MLRRSAPKGPARSTMDTIEKLLTGRPLITVSEGDSVMDAVRAMTEHEVGSILVTGAAGKAVGIFTERDLMTRVVVPRRDPDRVAINEVMTRELFFGRTGQSVEQVCREMQRRHIRHLPVIDGEKVVGVLSLRDLLRHDLEVLADEVEHLTEYIQGPGEGDET